MTEYKCGHKSEFMFIKANDDMAMIDYNMWREDTGFDGDISECFPCYLKRIREEEIKNNEGKEFPCMYPCTKVCIGILEWRAHFDEHKKKGDTLCHAMLEFDTEGAPFVTCDHWAGHPGNHKGLFYEWDSKEDKTIAHAEAHHRMRNLIRMRFAKIMENNK